MAFNQLASVVKGGEDDIGEDRISQLSDEIIHKILRNLKSHGAAARASVLSRRWLKLWRSYPFFEFESSKSSEIQFRSLESHGAAARTSVLSRRWLQLWRCYPFFEFKRSKSSVRQFRSFVDSSSKKLLPPPPLPHSDSDHNYCASVEAIQNFWISLRDGDFQKVDLDRLLSLLLIGISPDTFGLKINGSIELGPFYSLQGIPNWSRTKSIVLNGCDLASAFCNNGGGVASLGSLESLDLDNVNLDEELLHWFLTNAPGLASLCLMDVYGIDRLEVVSSRCLLRLCLSYIYRDKWSGLVHGRMCMRRLRISSPELRSLILMGPGLEEFDIDAPKLDSLMWNFYDSFTKVNVVSLSSNCRSTVNLNSHAERITPEWLRMSLSTMFNQLPGLYLYFYNLFYPSSQQQQQVLSDFPPKMIDQVHIGPLPKIRDIDEAATFVDALFWACRPKFMSITTGADNDLIVEYVCSTYLRSDSFNGVNAATTTSWCRHLKDMKIKNDVTDEMMKISKDVISSLAKQKRFRFMLTWT